MENKSQEAGPRGSSTAGGSRKTDGRPSVERAGIKIERLFTTEGRHPYDDVTWDRRDIVQANWKTGETVFEQRGVEFPDTWSANASTIVTTKYFRGALGTEQREWSLRQLIDRVVLTYGRAGREHGYFSTETDAQIFEHELTWMLLHQVFSFNSPVWFNVGTTSPHQVSACFILSVDDTMDSILNWYREEGLIFKGGSGAGLNLSRIRSSKELLRSSGGTASGPVSFMRGADASAGTIKSGGATRRAAKMVVLDVDHPDIGEFIETKWREEEKIRVLRDAGFDMDLGGKDITSVQYQNANNSVRVSDEFMRAVEGGGEFGLRARTTGDVIETVDARGLFDKLCQAAWACADPGIQYDDTINDWHTNSESGRITASNPCSEYMSLDNSSCNLASLNLLTFLKPDGSFDSATFARAVELVVTAMDISICFADFPTESIARTTREFRQLGVGYANLGALLMACGFAYDSEAGRALAAGITSLMTGSAYKRSAELAGVVGPYDGFAQNEGPHARVMRKHAAATDSVRPVGVMDADVLAAATKVWDECLRIGAVNGWRNAQASVLAPTGTIGFMMDCDTTGIEPDFSLVKFKKLVGGGSMQIVNQTVARALGRLGYPEETIEAIVEHVSEHGDVVDAPGLRQEHYSVFDCAMGTRSISPMGHIRMMAAVQPFISGAISKCVTGESLVSTEDGLIRIRSWFDGEEADTFRDHIVAVDSIDGTRKTDAFYFGGSKPVRRVVLRSGHEITGTPNHRLLTAGDSGGLSWRRLDEILPGEQVATKYGADLWAAVPASLRHVATGPLDGSQGAVRLPQEMSADLAFLLGSFAAAGHAARSDWTVTITNADEGVLARVLGAWQTEFGLAARVSREAGQSPAVVVSSRTVVEFLDALGCGDRAGGGHIPDAVLASPRPVVVAFLEGLSLVADVIGDSTPRWVIRHDSPQLLDDLQAIMTNMGVVHGRSSTANRADRETRDEIQVLGEYALALVREVPFSETNKRRRAADLEQAGSGESAADVVPGISGRELYDLLPQGSSGRGGAGAGGLHEFRFLLSERTGHVSRRALERVAAFEGVVLPDWLQVVLRDNLRFSPVRSVENSGEREVFDISVPGTHAFVANGIVNHNTVNMPESAAVSDVREIYLAGWKLGLKALAIYRDNCKVGQPLSDGKAGSKATEEHEHRPIRKRLPKSRPAQTVSFSVGGAEGYMTASSYPDNGLGEIFLKMSKQGSTLAGMMDAFSIAISIGLQYGVPLEQFVQKFTNMRFEPAGITDDADVRMAQSIMDYIFRRLALDFLPYDVRESMGIFTASERTEKLEQSEAVPGAAVRPGAGSDADARDSAGPGRDPGKRGGAGVHSSMELMEAIQGKAADAPLCLSCGIKMRPSGSCYACEGCGSTSGCS